MAKKDQKLTLAELTAALKSSDSKMNPAIAAQLEAAMAQPSQSSVDIVQPMQKLTSAIQQNTVVLTRGKTKETDLSENQIEDRKVQEDQTELLEKIEENTRPVKITKGTSDKSGLDFNLPGLNKLGLFGTLLAGALGAITGVLVAQAKVMVGTLKLLYKMLPGDIVGKVIAGIKRIPQLLNDMVTKVLINIEYAFNIVTDLFKNRFPKTFAAIEEVVVGFRNFFVNVFEKAKAIVTTIAEVVVKAFNFLKDGFIKYFAEPIEKGIDLIRQGSKSVSNGVGKISGFIQGIKDFFTGIGNWLGNFAKVFKGAMIIAEKIALPITIIMGLFDGITEAIKGYEKGGILGGIQGFITGALNSLVGSFLDLIKNVISWILDKLGFDDASKFLDSFSFSDMIKKFVDAIFHPIDTIKSAFNSLIKWMSGIQIPQFSIAGFKFGPWKPFSGMEKFAAETAPTTKTEQAPAAVKDEDVKQDKVKTVPPESSANKVYSDSAKNEEAKQKPASTPAGGSTVVTTQQVNNQTQNAMFKSPVRNSENTLSSYLKTRYV
jgi:hypothetical protein